MAEEGEHTAGVDVLHPLARFQSVRWYSWRRNVQPKHCVFLQDKVAILNTGFYGNGDTVCISSTNYSSWIYTQLPHCDTSLSTYEDQLVAVGGRHPYTGAPTNELLTISDNHNWHLTLPAMPTKRYYTATVSSKSPTILVVAGGCSSSHLDLNIVEVLLNNQWSTVASLPASFSEMKSILHAGNIYFTPGPGQMSTMYTCTCDSLCTAHDDRTSVKVWTEIQAPCNISTIASCTSRLMSIDIHHVIRGYSNGHWTDMTVGGDWKSRGTGYMAAAELPTRGLVVADEDGVFELTLSVSTFDPDSRLISSDLYRLEAVMELKIVPVLISIYQQLTTSSGLTLEPRLDKYGREIQLPDPQTAPNQYAVEAVLLWSTKNCPHPPTWRDLLHVLQEVGQLELKQQIEAFMEGDARYFGAYLRFIETKESLDLFFLKLLFLGPPRLGKTTVRRRLLGEIIDLVTAGEDHSAQPSTGAVESENLIVRKVSSSTAVVAQSEWSLVEDLNDEVRMVFHNLVDTITREDHESFRSTQSEIISTQSEIISTQSISTHKPPSKKVAVMKPSQLAKSSNSQVRGIVAEPTQASHASIETQVAGLLPGTPEVHALFNEGMGPKYWKDVKHMFKAILRVEDTGGQPELMDMLPALTVGPGLYLLFVNLQNDLDHHYKLSFCDKSGTSTPPVESVYTVKELLLTCLSSISCSNAFLPISCLDGQESSSISNVEDILKKSQSVAYIVGTHKDKVSGEQIKKLNKELIKVIESTDFYKKGIIQFYSKEELIVTLDNLKGGSHEINLVKDMLENIMNRHFKKLQIPAVWLIFSLILRRKKKKTASLTDCLESSASLNMTHEETEVALWFLHHHAGVLMYFSDIPELKDLVIIDVQVVYDSVTILILRALNWEEVGHYNAQKFRKTGKFTIAQLTAITSKVSGDFIPIGKLVVLLEYLHIIARISPHQQTSSSSEEEVTYIMPCLLGSANKEELDTISKKPQEVCPIMVRFKCGFVPIGIFPAMIACLINNKSFRLVEEGIKKNVVQFHYGPHCTLLCFISHSTYYKVIISKFATSKVKAHIECPRLRENIESILKTVSSRVNYGSFMDYQFAFECREHSESIHDHLCIVEETDSVPDVTLCLQNIDHQEPLELTCKQKLWFGQIQHEPQSSHGAGNVQLFTKEFANLVTATNSSIYSMGDQCLSEGLISQNTYDEILELNITKEDKARKLLINVKKVITGNSQSLLKFLQVLQDLDICDDIVTRIKRNMQMN